MNAKEWFLVLDKLRDEELNIISFCADAIIMDREMEKHRKV
jgi:hypothetical protein